MEGGFLLLVCLVVCVAQDTDTDAHALTKPAAHILVSWCYRCRHNLGVGRLHCRLMVLSRVVICDSAGSRPRLKHSSCS
ncbi:hypothetical protein BDW62DRAFT_185863 [Aspergillus aurantiobrunneus]